MNHRIIFAPAMFHIPCHELSHHQLNELARAKLKKQPENWEEKIWQVVELFTNPAVTSLTFYTSGSTGTPKQIQAQKIHLSASANATLSFLNIQKNSNSLLCLPADKIGGAMVIIRAIVRGLNLICIRPSATPLSDVPDSGIQLASFTPMQFFSVTQHEAHFRIAENIHTILLGGSGVSQSLLQRIAKMRNRVFSTYGMTETLSHIALKKISHPAQLSFFPMEGVQLETDADSALVITAPFLGVQSLQTNDIVKLNQDKSFEWLGRKDNIINSGGIKIIPETLEAKLQEVITVPFFIAGLPDQQYGELLTLILEKNRLTTGETNLLLEQIANIPDITLKPRRIIAVPNFVRTETGKIMRKETLQAAALLT